MIVRIFVKIIEIIKIRRHLRDVTSTAGLDVPREVLYSGADNSAPLIKLLSRNNRNWALRNNTDELSVNATSSLTQPEPIRKQKTFGKTLPLPFFS